MFSKSFFEQKGSSDENQNFNVKEKEIPIPSHLALHSVWLSIVTRTLSRKLYSLWIYGLSFSFVLLFLVVAVVILYLENTSFKNVFIILFCSINPASQLKSQWGKGLHPDVSLHFHIWMGPTQNLKYNESLSCKYFTRKFNKIKFLRTFILYLTVLLNLSWIENFRATHLNTYGKVHFLAVLSVFPMISSIIVVEKQDIWGRVCLFTLFIKWNTHFCLIHVKMISAV